jgi:hypothetical protein
MKVYIVTNKTGILMGAYRELKEMEIELEKYKKEVINTEPDIYVWELTSEQVGTPISNKYKCIKILKI